MQQTNQYKLNLIESRDTFSTAPLNENAEKLETALNSLTQSIEAVGEQGVRIATGSYTGAGTYGTSHPNSLTFSFKPLLVVVGHGEIGQRFGVWVRGAAYGCSYISPDSVSEVKLTWTQNGVSWSSQGSASSQLNNTGTSYHYTAIGIN